MARSNGLRSAVALAIVLSLGALASLPASAQTESEKPVTLKGKLERIHVFGHSLEGNLLGETASPDVSIYLPPSYATERNRRYPVVYMLHGYTNTDLGYFGTEGRQAHVIAERVFGCGQAQRDDPRDAELHERLRRLHVLELGDGRRLGRLRRRRSRRLHGLALPHARAPREPRDRRPFDGRLRHAAHRHETPRRVLGALRTLVVLLERRHGARARRGTFARRSHSHARRSAR